MKLSALCAFCPRYGGGGGGIMATARTWAVLLSAAAAWPALSGEERVVSTPEELVAALHDMSTNAAVNVVTLKAGTYDLATLETPMSIDAILDGVSWLAVTHPSNWDKPTLRGDPTVPRDQVVLDGGGARGILSLKFGTSGSGETFHVRNLTFRNGSTAAAPAGPDAAGGAIRTKGGYGELQVTDCAFFCNRANGSGGAVGGVLSHRFADCRFETNAIVKTGWGFGGAVDFATRLERCAFIANSTKAAVSAARTRDSVRALVTNCVFEANVSPSVWGSSASALWVKGGGEVVDCTFLNNVFSGTIDGDVARCGGAALSGGAGKETDVVRCRFLDNRFEGECNRLYGGAVYGNLRTIDGCLFSGNEAKAPGDSYGGAIAFCNGLITNCTFVGNAAKHGGALYACSNVCASVLTGNRTTLASGEIGGGAAYRCVLAGCVVTNNFGIYKNGALYECTALDSYFADNWGGREEAVQESEHCHFERCVLVGRSDGAQRQEFTRDCSYSASVISNMNSLLLFQGAVHATNTLVFACSAWVMCRNARGALVNCTFADNRYDILTLRSSDKTPEPLTFANTLLYGHQAYSDWGSGDDLSVTTTGPSAEFDSFTNCYFKTKWTVAGSGNLNVAERPSLASGLRLMTPQWDARHPFAPRRRCVLNGAGVVQDWMRAEGASDLAGQGRLTDGVVAIGAYETTERGPFPGLSVVVR